MLTIILLTGLVSKIEIGPVLPPDKYQLVGKVELPSLLWGNQMDTMAIWFMLAEQSSRTWMKAIRYGFHVVFLLWSFCPFVIENQNETHVNSAVVPNQVRAVRTWFGETFLGGCQCPLYLSECFLSCAVKILYSCFYRVIAAFQRVKGK